MLKYTKYLKDVGTNNKILCDIKKLALTEECNSVVMMKMLTKLNDQRRFTLPIKIGQSEVVHALSDFEVSINYIALSTFSTLGLGKSMTYYVVLQMEDRIRVVLKGIIKDFLIKAGKFIIPTDFMIFHALMALSMLKIRKYTSILVYFVRHDVFFCLVGN